MNRWRRALPRGVAIIGGGRWAGVIASVLRQVWQPDWGDVVLHSPSNPGVWLAHAKENRWRIASSLSDVMDNPEITHTIIARRARDNASSVVAALAASKTVLVEKPFCLTEPQLTQVLAASEGRNCMTGLVFLFASNLERFRTACLRRGQVRSIRVHWGDPVSETRHGAPKRFDRSVNVVQDVMPHIWSIIRPFTDPSVALEVRSASPRPADGSVGLRMRCGLCEIVADLSRAAPRRTRVIEVVGQGWDATLDFSTEPGTAIVEREPIDVAEGFTSPLRQELSTFLTGIPSRTATVSVAREAIEMSIAAMRLLRSRQHEALRAAIWTDEIHDQVIAEIADEGVDFDGCGSSQEEVAAWRANPQPLLVRGAVGLP
jgi:predicted dehydrogenase